MSAPPTLCYTDPAQVQDFVERTGVDSLAIAIGTSHGAYKFKPGQKAPAPVRYPERGFRAPARLPHRAARRVLRDSEYVEMINQFGGKMPDAIGIPEDMLRGPRKWPVCKINVDSDLRLAMTAAVRKVPGGEPLPLRSPPVFEPGPRRHQVYRYAQDRDCSGMRRQGLSFAPEINIESRLKGKLAFAACCGGRRKAAFSAYRACVPGSTRPSGSAAEKICGLIGYTGRLRIPIHSTLTVRRKSLRGL